MQIKEFSIALDMKRTLAFPPFEVVEGDTGNVLHVTLTNDGEAVELDGCNVCIVFASSAGFAIQDLTSGIALGEGAGTFSVTLYPGSYGAGDVRADVQVYSGDNEETLITSKRFTFRCIKGLMQPDIIRAGSAYPPLVQAAQTAREAAAEARAAAAQARSIVQSDWTEADATDAAYIKNKPGHLPPSAHATTHAAGGTDAITLASIGAAASAHASRHAAGGADAITPASIGAAANDHVHGNITNDGKLGGTTGLPLFTGTGGTIGTKTIQDAATAMGYSKPNLLDNWDFRNPVNQRGITSKTGSAYGIDRWVMSGSGSCITVNNGYITLSLAAANNNWRQFIEYPTVLSGMTVTATVRAKAAAGAQFAINLYAGENVILQNCTGTGVYKYYTATGTVPTVSNGTALRFGIVATDGAISIDITAVKLETGSISTLINDPPADFAAQLAKCQRYLVVFPVGYIGYALATTASYGSCIINLPCAMRTTPAFIFVNDYTDLMVTKSNVAAASPLAMAPLSLSLSSINVSCNLEGASGSFVTDGAMLKIYNSVAGTALSAEL